MIASTTLTRIRPCGTDQRRALGIFDLLRVVDRLG
jgi:hypothetical protein